MDFSNKSVVAKNDFRRTWRELRWNDFTNNIFLVTFRWWMSVSSSTNDSQAGFLSLSPWKQFDSIKNCTAAKKTILMLTIDLEHFFLTNLLSISASRILLGEEHRNSIWTRLYTLISLLFRAPCKSHAPEVSLVIFAGISERYLEERKYNLTVLGLKWEFNKSRIGKKIRRSVKNGHRVIIYR